MSRERGLRIGASLLSGIALALSFPNASLTILAFFAIAPIIAVAVRADSSGEAFLLGTLFYTTTWLINLPWVIVVMSKFGGLPLPVGILIFAALATLEGLFGGLFALIIHRLRLGPRFLPWLIVPLAWAGIELIRSYLWTGFPWNLLAAAIVDLTVFVKVAALVGPYGVGALVVTSSTVLAWMFGVSPKNRVIAVAATAAFLIAWGATGIALIRSSDAGGERLRVALIQPNISQEMRWDSEGVASIFQKMAALTRSAAASHADVIIWPESTVPLAFATVPFYRDLIESIGRESGADIILGSIAEAPDDPSKLWNAAYLVSGGAIQGRYDKIHLVPFGEYVPMRKFLFFAGTLVRAVGNFQFGTRETPLEGKLRYGPAICYEVVFPSIVRSQVVNGAEVLVTITNDAWFGNSSAPKQHLNSARLRAVETDRYLLRSATTGISVLADPDGRILDSIELNHEGMIIGEFVPRQSTTPYVRFGDWFPVASLFAVAIALIVRRKARE